MTATASMLNGSERPVLTYARLLRCLHEFIRRDQRETLEAEAIADQMDRPWLLLTEQERERVGGLAEDLYALAEGTPKAIAMSPSEAAAWQAEAKPMRDRVLLGLDLDAALAFLRRPHPPDLSPDAVPFLQGQCWERLGDDETALVFYREAARLDRRNASTVITILEKLRRYEEAAEVGEGMIGAPDAGPEELYVATSPLLALARGRSRDEAKQLFERVIETLRRATQLVDTGTSVAPPAELRRRISFALAMCLRELGRTEEARQTLDEAIAKAPRDSVLLASRGYLRAATDATGALSDFASAIRQGVASFWPYFFLARHALQQGEWADALAFATRAMAFPAVPAALAEAYEVIAIAQSAIGEPAETVLENFDRAVGLSPSNDRIRANREVARRMLSESQTRASLQAELHQPEGEIWQFLIEGQGRMPTSAADLAAEQAFAGV